MLGDIIIEKTQFALKSPLPARTEKQGRMVVHGRVRGYISGNVDAEIHGVIHGDLSAVVDAGALEEREERPYETNV